AVAGYLAIQPELSFPGTRDSKQRLRQVVADKSPQDAGNFSPLLAVRSWMQRSRWLLFLFRFLLLPAEKSSPAFARSLIGNREPSPCPLATPPALKSDSNLHRK